jgi:amino-acid N-acetyltransferase
VNENLQDPVERLWRRTTRINALVLVPNNIPVHSNEYHKIIQALLRLQQLGICPVVIIDDNLQSNDDSETCENSREAACQLVEMIDTAGGRARPIWSDVLLWRDEAISQQQINNSRIRRAEYQVERLDANLTPVKAAIALNQIPIIAPCAISMNGQWQRVTADAALVAIARQSAHLAKHAPNNALSFHKLILINEYGGLPRHALINIIDEVDSIRASLSGPSKTAHCRTLWLAEHTLAYLPGTASALAIAAQHSSAILANVITEKPEWSPSLPEALKPMQAMSPSAILNIKHQHHHHRLLTTPINYTVLRRGMELRACKQLDELDRSALFTLLEQSFGRKLMVEQYWQRLVRCHTGTIVAGDYQGAAIMTKESTNISAPGPATMIYLDKFAVSPCSQGLGVADIVWHRMQQIYPAVTWRSRANNGVNGW